MNAKNVIDTILEHEKTTRYRLAKRLGVHESLLSRAYNQKSDPGFSEVSSWLDKLGYTITISQKPVGRIDSEQAFSIDSFAKMLSTLSDGDYNYLAVHRYLKQLLESYASQSRKLVVSIKPNQISNRNWRAFYAASVAYLAKMLGESIKAQFKADHNRVEKPWSPIRSVSKSRTDFDETYAEYNVFLPKGELKWF